MTSNIECRRARKEILLGSIHGPSYGRVERRLEFDDDLLSLRRADRHAPSRGRDRGGEQAVRVGDQQFALRQVQEATRRANHDCVMRRINCERREAARMQTFKQR